MTGKVCAAGNSAGHYLVETLKKLSTYIHTQSQEKKRSLVKQLRWAKTRVLKTDTRVSKRARFKNTSVSGWFLDLF